MMIDIEELGTLFSDASLASCRHSPTARTLTSSSSIMLHLGGRSYNKQPEKPELAMANHWPIQILIRTKQMLVGQTVKQSFEHRKHW